MATITLERVSKVYPNGFQAVNAVELTVADGEFMVLVGPSGCGKTTLLRMIAGLETISSGEVRIGDRVVNQLGPKERDIAMVFQNYALYPHMTVAQNTGFALKLAKLPKAQIGAKVRGAAQVLGLTQWLERKPAQLSGGQRQRVAMGRAIVREPAAFLMDEPLSNLDAKLRVQMRTEISRIQRRLDVATVYVTHDQVEAMTMGDRVAVMRDGVILQCDDPQSVYEHPLNMFVAAFIGSPAMNLYEGIVESDAAAVRLGSQRLVLPQAVRTARPSLARYAGRELVVGLRPEHLAVESTQAVQPVLEGHVELVEALGSELLVYFDMDATRVRAEGAREADEEELVMSGQGVARVPPRARVRPGDRVRFTVDVTEMHFFDPVSGESIVDGRPAEVLVGAGGVKTGSLEAL
jgi:multiple sugar transport system ATP-binding protein